MDESLRAIERSASQGDPAALEKLERLRRRMTHHETTAEVLAELEAVQQARRVLVSDLREGGMKEFDAYVDAVFAREPGLHVVVIRGYIPGFLDGDLCEHSQSVSIRHVAEEASEAAEGAPRNELSPEQAREYERALGEFEPILHLRYRTNWQLTLRRGAVGVEKDLTGWSCDY